jgi:ABC-type lipoprotein release transport system permease subunit
MRRSFALLEHAVGALARRPGKTLALVLSLALVSGMLASILFVHDALEREAASLVRSMPELTVQAIRGGRPERIDPVELEFLDEHPGVRARRPRVWGYLYVPSIGANVSVVAVDPRTPELAGVTSLLEGAPPRAAGEATVGDAFARSLGLRPGDSIALPTSSGFHLLHIAGVFSADASLQAADVVLVTEPDARVLLGYDDELYTDVALSLASMNEAEVVSAAITRALPHARVVRRDQIERAYALTFGARAGLVGAMLLPLLGCFLLLAWDRLTGLGEDERRELGVLSLVGWDLRDILLAGLFQNGLIALSGAALGILSAHLYVFVFGAPLLIDALLGWSRLHPTLELTPTFDAAALFTVLAFVVVPFSLASLTPAFRAANVDVDSLLRGGGG